LKEGIAPDFSARLSDDSSNRDAAIAAKNCFLPRESIAITKPETKPAIGAATRSGFDMVANSLRAKHKIAL
jgi:hypothetical protein